MRFRAPDRLGQEKEKERESVKQLADLVYNKRQTTDPEQWRRNSGRWMNGATGAIAIALALSPPHSELDHGAYSHLSP